MNDLIHRVKLFTNYNEHSSLYESELYCYKTIKHCQIIDAQQALKNPELV